MGTLSKTRLLLAATVVLALAAACNAAPAAPSGGTGAAQAGGTVTVALTGEIGSLDPAAWRGPTTASSCLLRWDRPLPDALLLRGRDPPR